MSRITITGLSMQFDADQVTTGVEEEQVRQAIAMVNDALAVALPGLDAVVAVTDEGYDLDGEQEDWEEEAECQPDAWLDEDTEVEEEYRTDWPEPIDTVEEMEA